MENSPTNCHLRRSNAIRIKTRNLNRDLPSSLQASVCTTRLTNEEQNKIAKSDGNDPGASMLEQIRRGVRLRRVNQERAVRYEQHQYPLDSVHGEENLSSLLARVLQKRNSVMQLTDDESDLSSINSQPESLDMAYCYSIRCERATNSSESTNNQIGKGEANGLDTVVKL